MLVLSRRLNQRIVFPGFKASVQIVGLQSGIVRLGIDAPPEVTVLREEVPDRVSEWGEPPPAQVNVDQLTRLRKSNRILRHRLLSCSADLKLLRRQLRMGFYEDAGTTLDKLQKDVQLQRQ
jgi:two-component system, OmpR family, response regulator